MLRRLVFSLSFVVACASVPAKPVAFEPAVEPEPAAPKALRLEEVNALSVALLGAELEAARDAKETDVTLHINSPGGSVYAGLALINLMQDVRKSGTQIHCVVTGTAASMAAVVLETGCSDRTMVKGSALLFHEPSIYEVGGNEHELRRVADLLADMNRRIAIMVSPSLGMTARQYENWVRGRDRWLDWDEALELGAIDVVIP